MGLWTWARRRGWRGDRHAQADVNISRVLPRWQENRPLPNIGDYANFAEEGFRRNVVINTCITEIATSVAEPQLQARGWDGKDWQPLGPEHRLQQLLDRPNEEDDGFSLHERLLIHLHVGGKAFIHKVRSGSGNVVELRAVRPDRIKPIPGSGGALAGWSADLGGYDKRRLPPEDIIGWAFPDPLDDWAGLSPIMVAARVGDLDNRAADWLRAFMLNGGTVKGLLITKGKLQKTERERVQTQWEERHTGTGGYHSVSVLDQDVTYQAIGSSPKDVDLSPLWDITESRICGVFHVPPIIVGTRIGLMRSTYSNYAQAQKSFWSETLCPLYRKLSSKYTRHLASEFGDRLSIVFDTSRVAALQQSEQDKRQAAIDGWNAGLLTRNEARAAGYDAPRDTEGDVYKSTLNEQLEPASIEAAGLILDDSGLNVLRRIEAEHYQAARELQRSIEQAIGGNGNGKPNDGQAAGDHRLDA